MNRWVRLFLFLIVLLIGWYVVTQVLFASVQEDGQLLVAVIDSGVDYTHDELEGRIVKGKDFVDGDDDPMDENGHGTHVATQIVNKTTEASILAIRTLDENGKGGGESLLGVIYALYKGADIINMSYSETYHPFMPLFIWYGEKRDVLFVAATGNEGKKDIDYPAKYEGVIPIAAIDPERNELYEDNNLSEQVQFVAPGVRLSGADVGNQYSLRTGTSMATGYATGVIASLRETWPHMKKEAMLAYLGKHANPTKDGRFQLLEYERFAALTDSAKLYAKIGETPAITKEETLDLPVETLNIERIDGYNQKEERFFSTRHWSESVRVPLPKEGFQQITLRFYQGNQLVEDSFAILKDTRKPEISYLYTTKDFLSFIVTDHTLKTITINGKSANKFIRHSRVNDHTYHFVKPLSETYPITIEIEDQVGHKTTKILYDFSEK